MPENCLQEIVEGNFATARIHLGLGGHDMRLADVHLRRILDQQDMLVLRNGIGQHPQECRFS